VVAGTLRISLSQPQKRHIPPERYAKCAQIYGMRRRPWRRGKAKMTFFRFSQYIEAIIRFLPVEFYLFALKAQSLVRLKPRKLLRFEINIVDHCNLNCAGCEHFSPLAKKNFVKPNELGKDFARLSELAKGRIEMLQLMGGEPLLHPEIGRIIEISRKYFQIGEIKIVTNGILLTKMNKDFWELCQTNRIIISVTKYPVKLDINKITVLVKRYNVNFEYYNIGKKKMQNARWICQAVKT
jgi:ABC-2 type transport system ATP-binding protein